MTNFDWSELAFGSKKEVNNLKATFIAAPRTISPARFKQLIREYLPKGNIIVGISKEDYVLGLENQPQFRMQRANDLQKTIDAVNVISKTNKIHLLEYSQRDFIFIIDKLKFKQIVLVNGSWYFAFHLKPEYYAIVNKAIPYDMVSPFADEHEAKQFADSIAQPLMPDSGVFTEKEMLALVNEAAKYSYAYSEYQTGVVLGKQKGKKYQLLVTAHNKVVPYETYAMHHGASREVNFSPTNDLNHYDVVHAEVALLIKAQKQGISLRGTTLFINLLPCPPCARMLCETDITEIVYSIDHSDGYAFDLLQKASKNIRRVAVH